MTREEIKDVAAMRLAMLIASSDKTEVNFDDDEENREVRVSINCEPLGLATGDALSYDTISKRLDENAMSTRESLLTDFVKAGLLAMAENFLEIAAGDESKIIIPERGLNDAIMGCER